MCHPCGEVGGATNQVSGVRFNEERNEQHENRPIYTKLTNICTTSSLTDSHLLLIVFWAKCWLRGGVVGQFPENLN